MFTSAISVLTVKINLGNVVSKPLFSCHELPSRCGHLGIKKTTEFWNQTLHVASSNIEIRQALRDV